jgi:hypothetical protein
VIYNYSMEGKPKSPGYDRFVGAGDLEQLLKARNSLGVLEKAEHPLAYERQKTREEAAVIFEILDTMPEFIREYGAETERYVYSKQIHLVDETSPDAEKALTHCRGVAGILDIDTEQIEIVSSKKGLVDIAHTIVHELMHLHSFKSVTVKKHEPPEEGAFLEIRRVGLQHKLDDNFFLFMNEAMTEELTKRFCERNFPNSAFLKETFRKHAQDTVAQEVESPVHRIIDESAESLYSYQLERLHFVGLVESLYERNKSDFACYEDTFKLFSTAMFTGRLLPIARLIEKTFGPGSYRRLGENTAKEMSTPEDVLSALREFLSPPETAPNQN